MNVDVAKAGRFGKAHCVLFLDTGILAHDLGQFVLNLRQFGEFFAAQVVQSFGVPF